MNTNIKNIENIENIYINLFYCTPESLVDVPINPPAGKPEKKQKFNCYPVARKEHTCFSCGVTIEPGTVYFSMSVFFPGGRGWVCHRYCMDCHSSGASNFIPTTLTPQGMVNQANKPITGALLNYEPGVYPLHVRSAVKVPKLKQDHYKVNRIYADNMTEEMSAVIDYSTGQPVFMGNGARVYIKPGMWLVQTDHEVLLFDGKVFKAILESNKDIKVA